MQDNVIPFEARAASIRKKRRDEQLARTERREHNEQVLLRAGFVPLSDKPGSFRRVLIAGSATA